LYKKVKAAHNLQYVHRLKMQIKELYIVTVG